MRILTHSSIFLSLLCGFLLAQPSWALDITPITPMPAVVSADLIVEKGGEEILIEAPWTRQSLNIMNDNTQYALVIDSIEATSSCLEDEWAYGVEIFALHFDPEDMEVVLPVGSSSFDTGEMFIHGLGDCKKGHIVRLTVHGHFIDETGDYVDSDMQSTAFITRP